MGLLCNVAMTHSDVAVLGHVCQPQLVSVLLEENLDIDFDQNSSCGGKQRPMAQTITCNGCQTCKDSLELNLCIDNIYYKQSSVSDL